METALDNVRARLLAGDSSGDWHGVRLDVVIGRALLELADRVQLLESVGTHGWRNRPARVEALEAVANAARRRLIDRDGASQRELVDALNLLDIAEQRYKVDG